MYTLYYVVNGKTYEVVKTFIDSELASYEYCNHLNQISNDEFYIQKEEH